MARELKLLENALAAHGGLARWSCFATVQATITTGGQLFGLKGTPQDPTPRRMTVATQREWASVFPYGADDQGTAFTANRIAIEKLDGTVVKERLHPSEHAEGKAVDAPWDVLDRAYFNGYALWTYLTTPFHFAMPGFAVEEIEPWREGDELWQGLRVTTHQTSRATAGSRISTSAPTLCFGAMTTTWRPRGASRRPNMFSTP
jgi:hypothetical protein